jgi:hypothetical protein
MRFQKMARHPGKMSGTLQTYCYVTKFRKHLEVAPGPAAKIQNRKRRFTLDPVPGTGWPAGRAISSCLRHAGDSPEQREGR